MRAAIMPACSASAYALDKRLRCNTLAINWSLRDAGTMSPRPDRCDAVRAHLRRGFLLKPLAFGNVHAPYRLRQQGNRWHYFKLHATCPLIEQVAGFALRWEPLKPATCLQGNCVASEARFVGTHSQAVFLQAKFHIIRSADPAARNPRRYLIRSGRLAR
jgi:hypothetical protein